MSKLSLKDSALRTITMERDAITELLDRIDENFERACELILACSGRVVVTGMGKSGQHWPVPERRQCSSTQEKPVTVTWV